MAFIFSVEDEGKLYWFKTLEELPKIENRIFHIYPVYFIGSNKLNLLREEIRYINGKWVSKYSLLSEYLKSSYQIGESTLYFTGYDGFINVFLNQESYLDYALKGQTLKTIIL